MSNLKKILCLDISTTTVGWSEFDINIDNINYESIDLLKDCGYLSLKGTKIISSQWEKDKEELEKESMNILNYNDEHLFLKSSIVLDFVRSLIKKNGQKYNAIFIERPFAALQGSGKSSADVIIKLACFNFYLRNRFYDSDEFIIDNKNGFKAPTLSVDNIRKYAFPFIPKNKLKGTDNLTQKTVIFNAIKSLIKDNYIISKFELKKDGEKYKDECQDMTDSICVGLAVCELLKIGINII